MRPASLRRGRCASVSTAAGIQRRHASATACLLALLLLFVESLAQAAPYRFRVLDQSFGLDDLVVRDLLQDRTGFLWVATHTGLYRFDGRNFQRFSTNEGLASDWVTNLLEASDGTLWVSTSKGVCRRDGTGFQVVLRASESIRFSPAIGSPMAPGSGGTIYVSSLRGVFAVEPAAAAPSESPPHTILAPPLRTRLLLSNHGNPGFIVTPLGLDGQGNLCLFSGTSSFQCLNPLTSSIVWQVQVPPSNWMTLRQDATGAWVAGSAQRQLFRIRRGSPQPDLLPARYSGQGQLYLHPDGSMFVPADEGFQIQRAGWLESIHRDHGFPPDGAFCFLRDRKGTIWIGTLGSGLTQWLGPETWRGWDTADGLPGQSVSRFVQLRDGSQWVATNRGLATRARDEPLFRDAPLPHRIPQRNVVFGLSAGAENDLWFSNEQGVLYRWVPATNRLERFSAQNGVPIDMVCFLLWHQGSLWVADTQGIGRLSLSASGWKFERIATDLVQKAMAYSLTASPDGSILAGTSKGLLVIRGSETELLTTRDGLIADNVFGATHQPSGSIWVHYRLPEGISEVRGSAGRREVVHHRHQDGLLSDKVFALSTDNRGRVWAGTERGLSVLSDGEWFPFTRDDGLIWNDVSVHGVSATPDGALWIGTSRGLSRFTPPASLQWSPLRVAIFGLRTRDQEIPAPDDLQPITAPSQFRISFGAPRFANQDLIRFRYRLGGRGEWIESAEREVNFSRVEPGTHTFEVAAREGAGPWSPTSSLSIKVPTPWWRTWWAIALGLWLILALARGIWRWRYHRMLEHQKRLESAVGERTRQLEEQRQKAEAASQFKDQILANVSHEMRTPLNGILGFTDMILNTKLSDEQREHLQTVQASGKTLVDIIEDLLDFAAIESGEANLRPSECSLASIADQAARSVRFEVQRKGLRLEMKLAPSLPERILADAHRVRQILLNLISNAVKFTDHGSITVEAFALPADFASQQRVVFVVADDGIGIHPGHLPVIFEPFRQLDGTLRRRHGGAGLGLAIVKNLVDAFGGVITVHSELGRGSRFTVELPVDVLPTPSPIAADTPAPSDSQLRQRKLTSTQSAIRKVLIAEDNPVNQTLLERILTTKGLHVVAVSDGQAAVEAVESDTFDLILMDIQMPVMDGIEATRLIRMREQAAGTRIPIIAVTANGLFQCREQCMEVGMDGYVVKPFGPAGLFDAIARVTQQTETPSKPPSSASAPQSPSAFDTAQLH